jgi:hypothetical protein
MVEDYPPDAHILIWYDMHEHPTKIFMKEIIEFGGLGDGSQTFWFQQGGRTRHIPWHVIRQVDIVDETPTYEMIGQAVQGRSFASNVTPLETHSSGAVLIPDEEVHSSGPVANPNRVRLSTGESPEDYANRYEAWRACYPKGYPDEEDMRNVFPWMK